MAGDLWWSLMIGDGERYLLAIDMLTFRGGSDDQNYARGEGAVDKKWVGREPLRTVPPWLQSSGLVRPSRSAQEEQSDLYFS